MAFARRLAILPGGLGGLGTSIAQKLHHEGAHLALLYAPFEASRVDALLTTNYGSNSHDPTIRTYECDITSPDSVQAAFTKLEGELVDPASSTRDLPSPSQSQNTAGGVFPSILVNTAGYVSLSDLESTPPEETVRHLTTNVLGPMLCAQAFARLYFQSRKRAEADEGGGKGGGGGGHGHVCPPGRIVNIASQAAHVALPRHGAYCASKAALLGLTRSMASEWAGGGITANSVSPTVAWTELGKKAWGESSVREAFLKSIPTGKFALPEEVADAVLFLCQDSSGMINGADIRVDGGFTIR
ncbi:putative short-chain dehydrogenase/reductase [Aspergillus homomorphus CBS 101889]|uniref:Dehydrogenase with different specificitie n=1 Tax=Aspergillus homomorphus (strain CBS 101889) TaxID=1450537 RepID=A0A395I1G9_ASPHC|nr:dehydrogenase with different specificitie [Aspergillus homomorphus CBS 101889]RAL14021.1 dehydrogenase with different specificitie [Aspergillus homomorphus CBS 101889]